MMATRLQDMSPSSSRAFGSGEGANNKSPANKGSKAELRKALEMPMYDNEDLSLSKIQEVKSSQLSALNDDEASQM